MDLENHANPFSLEGARCRLRSPTARRSALRASVYSSEAPAPLTSRAAEASLTLRSAPGSAQVDPDELFADLGITCPKFTRTGQEFHKLQRPTPLADVLGKNARRAGERLRQGLPARPASSAQSPRRVEKGQASRELRGAALQAFAKGVTEGYLEGPRAADVLAKRASGVSSSGAPQAGEAAGAGSGALAGAPRPQQYSQPSQSSLPPQRPHLQRRTSGRSSPGEGLWAGSERPGEVGAGPSSPERRLLEKMISKAMALPVSDFPFDGGAGAGQSASVMPAETPGRTFLTEPRLVRSSAASPGVPGASPQRRQPVRPQTAPGGGGAQSPGPRVSREAVRSEFRAEARNRFSHAEAMRRVTAIKAQEAKLRDADREKYEKSLFEEGERRRSAERDLSVAQAQLEASAHEADALRRGLQLLMRKQEIEHRRLLQVEEENQGFKALRPLVEALGDQFTHVAPEAVIRKISTLESEFLRVYNIAQDAQGQLEEAEAKVGEAHLQAEIQLKKGTEQLTQQLREREAEISALRSEIATLQESVRLSSGVQARYLALSFAVADLWSTWTDIRANQPYTPQIQKLLGTGEAKLDPDLSQPLEVIRCLHTLLTMCYPRADAASAAYQRLAALANHAWFHLFCEDPKMQKLKSDVHGLLKACYDRAEGAEYDRQRFEAKINRLEHQHSQDLEEIQKLQRRIRRLELEGGRSG